MVITLMADINKKSTSGNYNLRCFTFLLKIVASISYERYALYIHTNFSCSLM